MINFIKIYAQYVLRDFHPDEEAFLSMFLIYWIW